MRTEEDLRRALYSLEPRQPHVPGLLDRVRTGAARRYRRRVVTAAAAGVVAVSAAAAVPIAVHQRHRAPTGVATGPTPSAATSHPTASPTTQPTPPPAAAPNRPLRLPWSLGPVPGYLAAEYRIEDGRQSAAIAKESDLHRYTAALVVFDSGRYDGSRIRAGGVPVQVNGRPGYYASAQLARTSRPTLAWEYADNAWALVQGDWPTTAATRTEELRLARAVRFAQPNVFRVGFRLRAVPTGLHVDYANLSVVGGGPTLDVELAERLGGDAAVDLSLTPGELSGSAPPTTTIGGNPARVDTRSITIARDGYLLSLSLTAHAGHATTATLHRLAGNVVWAPDLGNLGAWFDGTTFVG